ncbi:hypothetical protein [Streptomyces hygroscopicus]|uniref:hypothetical protein n=1 Tax=Streptomyces hygroscopicus TaxID=1912 RepID=UPI00223EF701|nr:hypothetical protein [Streptomyces hygroscopicus]
MRSKAARLIGIFAALALALGLGAAVELPAVTGTAAHQVLADEASPHTVQP